MRRENSCCAQRRRGVRPSSPRAIRIFTFLSIRPLAGRSSIAMRLETNKWQWRILNSEPWISCQAPSFPKSFGMKNKPKPGFVPFVFVWRSRQGFRKWGVQEDLLEHILPQPLFSILFLPLLLPSMKNMGKMEASFIIERNFFRSRRGKLVRACPFL